MAPSTCYPQLETRCCHLLGVASAKARVWLKLPPSTELGRYLARGRRRQWRNPGLRFRTGREESETGFSLRQQINLLTFPDITSPSITTLVPSTRLQPSVSTFNLEPATASSARRYIARQMAWSVVTVSLQCCPRACCHQDKTGQPGISVPRRFTVHNTVQQHHRASQCCGSN